MGGITVVGGGPAGTLSARLLASSGREVTVLEEHREAGVPMHCAGVVSPEVLQSLGVRPKVLGSISAADVVLPDGSVISTSKKMPYAFILDRQDLDQRLADAAVNAGADIRYGAHYKDYTVDDSGVTVRTNLGEFRSDLLVGADGQNSLIAASLGNNQVKYYLRGVQVDVRHRSEDPEKMILRLGNEVAPGFFSWQLPMGDLTRIGLAIGPTFGSPVKYLEQLLKGIGLQDAERVSTYAGKIPMGGRRATYADRILLIGDAAGQVKPVSGGGLYPISRAAPLLKETVDRAYSMNIFNSTILALYDRSWKRDFGRSISSGMRLRTYYDRLGDTDLNTIGHLFTRPDINEVLNDIDIDDPGAVVKPILHKKGVKSLLLKTYFNTRNPQ